MDFTIDELIRSKRRSISLEITRDGRLVVRAPLRMPNRLIEQAVAHKRDWIEEKLRDAAARDTLHPPKRCVEGESFELLGKHYALSFDANVNTIAVIGNCLSVPAVFAQDNVLLAQRLVTWYKEQAGLALRARVVEIAALNGITYESVRITSALSRWGSCSGKGHLCFSWRLVLAPPEQIDYVVVHELSHIGHPDHSAAFWRCVAQLMPDYALRREWFRQHAALLRHDFFAE